MWGYARTPVQALSLSPAHNFFSPKQRLTKPVNHFGSFSDSFILRADIYQVPVTYQRGGGGRWRGSPEGRRTDKGLGLRDCPPSPGRCSKDQRSGKRDTGSTRHVHQDATACWHLDQLAHHVWPREPCGFPPASSCMGHSLQPSSTARSGSSGTWAFVKPGVSPSKSGPPLTQTTCGPPRQLPWYLPWTACLLSLHHKPMSRKLLMECSLIPAGGL